MKDVDASLEKALARVKKLRKAKKVQDAKRDQKKYTDLLDTIRELHDHGYDADEVQSTFDSILDSENLLKDDNDEEDEESESQDSDSESNEVVKSETVEPGDFDQKIDPNDFPL